jgi:hypothetical protein
MRLAIAYNIPISVHIHNTSNAKQLFVYKATAAHASTPATPRRVPPEREIAEEAALPAAEVVELDAADELPPADELPGGTEADEEMVGTLAEILEVETELLMDSALVDSALVDTVEGFRVTDGILV